MIFGHSNDLWIIDLWMIYPSVTTFPEIFGSWNSSECALGDNKKSIGIESNKAISLENYRDEWKWLKFAKNQVFLGISSSAFTILFFFFCIKSKTNSDEKSQSPLNLKNVLLFYSHCAVMWLVFARIFWVLIVGKNLNIPKWVIKMSKRAKSWQKLWFPRNFLLVYF